MVQPPEGWPAFLVESLGIELYRIPVVVASAVIIYLVFLFLVRLFGARVLTGMSGFDTLVVIMLGSVAGRVILGHPPTVAAGVIGLVTLLAMERIFGTIEKVWSSRKIISARPMLVFAHGEPLQKACQKTHTSPADLSAAMRRAGVARPEGVECIILEPRGDYSVIKTGTDLDPDLFKHVLGADQYLFGSRN